MANRFKEMHKTDAKQPVQSAYDINDELQTQKSNPIANSKESVTSRSSDRVLIVEDIELRGLTCTRVDINDDLYATFKYYSKVNGFSQYQVTNALLKCDMEWTASHPEFPSQSFVKECIINSKKKWHNLQGRTALSLYSSEECKAHLKEMCAKTCMTTYQYFEFLIREYIGE